VLPAPTAQPEGGALVQVLKGTCPAVQVVKAVAGVLQLGATMQAVLSPLYAIPDTGQSVLNSATIRAKGNAQFWQACRCWE
jgi:hypothetical protein